MGSRAAVVLVLLAACGEPPALEVGRIGYTAEEISALSDEDRSTLIDLTAFAQAASDARLDEVVAPFVRRDLRSLTVQRTALEVAAGEAGLDEETLRQRYARDPDLELVVRHLVVLSERWRPEGHRDSARARAAEALELAHAGESFTDLVARYSDEPGAAERGGLLSPGREGSWVPEFWQAASRLEEGELSEVVGTEYGFHVIRLEERRPVPYEEARRDFVEREVALSTALIRSAEWVAEQTRGMEVDTAAVASWQRGLDPPRPLVRWPGGGIAPYRAADLDEYVLTLQPEALAELRARPAGEAATFVASVARNSVLLQQGDALDVEPTEAQRVTIERQWLERAEGWSRALGFEPRLGDRAVKTRSVEALRSDRQRALLTRREVTRFSTVLRALYPVRDHRTGEA